MPGQIDRESCCGRRDEVAGMIRAGDGDAVELDIGCQLVRGRRELQGRREGELMAG